MINQLISIHKIIARLILFPVVLLSIQFSYAQQSITTIQSKSKRIELSLETPRNFGYTAGDVIQHRIHITIPSGTSLNTNNLPSNGVYLDWLDVLDVQVNELSGREYNISVDYQFSKKVKETEWLEIPAFQLGANDGSEVDRITVPTWRFSYNSIIPSHIRDTEIIAQPAQQPLALPVQPIMMQLLAYVIAMLLCLAYLLWRRGNLQFWSRKTTPFQKALQALKKLPQQSSSEQIVLAFREVHTAFNQTAGETLFESQLDDFYQNYPRLASLRADTDIFFTQSRQIFYESDTASTQDHTLLKNLKQLCLSYDRLLKQR
jgi:mxaA protein